MEPSSNEHDESRRHALLTIEDTGVGIDEGCLTHIFEPFFTTKIQGEGTGLGLSVVHGIVKNHEGHIEVDSEVGRGTRFSLLIPIPEPEPAASSDAHEGRVILVAANDPVGSLLRSILVELGLEVRLAMGLEELESCLKDDSPPKLIVVDLDSDTPESALRVLDFVRSQSGIPYLVCTDLSQLPDDMCEENPERILGKPFNMAEFSNMVQASLAPGSQNGDE